MSEHSEESAVQLHFDVSQPPAHLRAEDRPDQDITLTAALSMAAAVENQAERFHHQPKKTLRLDELAGVYERKDAHRALRTLTRRNELSLTNSEYVDVHDDERLTWQVQAHYLDLRICVGSGLGLAAMLPNIAIHHAMEFRMDLFQRSRRFSAKYAKLGFAPSNCMLWIGRSSSGEDSWLGLVPTESLGIDAEDVPVGTGKEDTVMQERHYRITVMFLADMLQRIGYRDVTVTTRYPDVDDDEDYRFASNVM
jgi:hypothetical protein